MTEALSNETLPSIHWSFADNVEFSIIDEDTPLTLEEYKAQTQRPMSERIQSETKGNITVSIVDNIFKVKQYSKKTREDIAAFWSKRFPYFQVNPTSFTVLVLSFFIPIGALANHFLVKVIIHLRIKSFLITSLLLVILNALNFLAAIFFDRHLLYKELQVYHWKTDFAERFAIERANCFNYSLPYLNKMVMVSSTLKSRQAVYVSANRFISKNEANAITKEFLLRPQNKERLQRENLSS